MSEKEAKSVIEGAHWNCSVNSCKIAGHAAIKAAEAADFPNEKKYSHGESLY